MKKIITIITLVLLAINVIAQDTIRLKHTNYTTVFSKSKHYPVLVEWWETKAKDECKSPLPRKDQFASDPSLPNETNIAKDYTHSGTDRGHMCPAASNECSGDKVLTECFYFSNMAPQYHSLNAGDWKSLETFTRNAAIKDDSVHVWAGNIGEAKKIGVVSIPTQCWKVIHILKTNQWLAYLFNNDTSHPDGIENNKVSLETIEKLTNFKFKN
jgi:endonuclease G